VEQLAAVFEASRPAVAVVAVDRLLGEYRIPQDSAAGRRVLVQALEERRAAEAAADYQSLRRGWCLGGATFRQELLVQMTERMGAEHYGEERPETDVTKAERILRAELKARRWQESDLVKRAKGHPGKVRGSLSGYAWGQRVI
jgi:hypothetical protein